MISVGSGKFTGCIRTQDTGDDEEIEPSLFLFGVLLDFGNV